MLQENLLILKKKILTEFSLKNFFLVAKEWGTWWVDTIWCESDQGICNAYVYFNRCVQAMHIETWSSMSSLHLCFIYCSQLIVFSINRCCPVAKSCLTLRNPTDCSTPSVSVLYCLLEFSQTNVHWVSDAIQPAHPLSPSSPTALSLCQHQGLFQWIGSSHQVNKVLELQLQHQLFQGIFRVDFLAVQGTLKSLL